MQSETMQEWARAQAESQDEVWMEMLERAQVQPMMVKRVRVGTDKRPWTKQYLLCDESRPIVSAQAQGDKLSTPEQKLRKDFLSGNVPCRSLLTYQRPTTTLSPDKGVELERLTL